MITHEAIADLIRRELPGARVETYDRTGTSDHYNVRVVAEEFADMSLLDRHRAVYAALSEALRDGRLHAVELTTEIP